MRNAERRQSIAEMRRLNAETRKIELEIERIRAKKQKSRNLIRRYTPLATFLVALAAIGSFLLNLAFDFRTQPERRTAYVEKTLSNLSAPEPFRRASAALALGEIASHFPDLKLALQSLAEAAAVEKVPYVRSTQLSVLRKYRRESGDLLKQIRIDHDILAIAALSDWGNLLAQLDRLKEEGANSGDLSAHRTLIDSQREAVLDAQYGAIGASDLLRKLNCSQDETCPIDLSGLHLRLHSFVSSQIDYRSAIFNDAHLISNDFFGVDLTDAKFRDAYLSNAQFYGAILTNASFANAKIKLWPGKLSEREYSDCLHANGTRFPANVDGVNFLGAVLSGADLSESNITREQLQETVYIGATLPEALAKELNHSNPDPLSIELEGKEGARKCNRDSDNQEEWSK
ncbi:MAG: pentapeptide repeat-containing protein [bacterium]|nr:pentapeptide repeat-containing protein [bacterium]